MGHMILRDRVAPDALDQGVEIDEVRMILGQNAKGLLQNITLSLQSCPCRSPRAHSIIQERYNDHWLFSCDNSCRRALASDSSS
jgi:hypothetical protein